MDTLICTVGLPRSGKSTWCKKMQEEGWVIVNPDSIRLALHGQRYCIEAEGFVWATAKVMVKALFLAGNNNIIFDATNTSKKRRDEWRSSMWRTEFKIFDTSPEICKERAIKDDMEDLISIIDAMYNNWDALSDEELYKKEPPQ